MTTQQWQEVDVPRGAFISWGDAIGQHVTGKVLGYDETGGTDFNNNVCPQLQVELIEPAVSINKTGQQTQFPAGELVVLNCGQVSLKRAVRAAALNTGDLVKIELSNLVNTSNGTVKEFSIKVARGAGVGTSSQPQAAPPAQPPATTVQQTAAQPVAQPAGQASGPYYPPGVSPEAVAAVRAAGQDPAVIFPGYRD